MAALFLSQGFSALFVHLFVLHLLLSSPHQLCVSQRSPDPPLASLPQNQFTLHGDAMIGLFVPIFSRNLQSGTCRDYDFVRSGELLVTEAFLQSVVWRHRLSVGNSAHAPSLGYVLMDTCHSTLATTAGILKAGFDPSAHWNQTTSKRPNGTAGSLTATTPLISDGCSAVPRLSKTRVNATRNLNRIAALIGPTTADSVLNVSPLLSAFRLPHIISAGPGTAAKNQIPICDSTGENEPHGAPHGASEGSDLSCNLDYEYLFSTVPSEENIVHALLDVMEKFDWWHVTVLADIASQSSNLLSRFTNEVERRNRASRSKICVAFTAILPNSKLETRKLDSIVASLKQHHRARVVVMMAQAKPAMVLFRHIVNSNERIPRVWLATEWGKEYLIYNNQAIAATTLTTMIRLWLDVPMVFQPLTLSIMKAMGERLSKITLAKLQREENNPWLCLNWGASFNCRDVCSLGKFDNVCHGINGDFSECVSDRRLPPCNLSDPTTFFIDGDIIYYTSSSHTTFATEIVVQALTDLWNTTQRRYPNLSHDERRTKFVELSHSNELLDILKHVKLPCGPEQSSWCEVFDAKSNFRQVSPSYSLLTTRLTLLGHRKFVKLGLWESSSHQKNKLTIFKSHRDVISWSNLTLNSMTGYPLSDCRLPCDVGEITTLHPHSCCWTCERCQGNNYTKDNNSCWPCPDGEHPDKMHLKCVPLPRTVFVRQWYIALGFTAGLVFIAGIPLTVTVIVIVRKRKTIALRSADPHLMIVMTSGMLLSLLSLSTLFLPPSDSTCSLCRALITPWQLMTIVTMLMKTLRLTCLWLSAKEGKRVRSRWMLTTAAQVIYICLISLTGMMIEGTLAFGLGSKVEERFNDSNTYIVCTQNASQLVMDVIIFLVVLCILFLAFVIRKMPTMANESQKLFLASFCITATWVLLTPVYYLSSDYLPAIISLRAISQIMSLWAWIVLPRLYCLKDSAQKVRRLSQRRSFVRSFQGGFLETSSVAGYMKQGTDIKAPANLLSK